MDSQNSYQDNSTKRSALQTKPTEFVEEIIEKMPCNRHEYCIGVSISKGPSQNVYFLSDGS